MFRKIVGVDLLSGESPEASREPRLAYAVLVDGEVRESGEASLTEILEIVEKLRADAVAVDNVYELAPSLRELQSLLASLTHVPRLVQAAMVGGKAYPLVSFAVSLGLRRERGKLSPQQAAEVSAKLCYLGVGSELMLFESNETRIVVSKGRSPTQGGMSSDRFRRSVEGLVLRKTREIKALLEERSLDYDLFVTRGAHGIERSVFTVYAPREKLHGLVRPLRNHNIHIRVEPVERRECVFTPLTSQPKAVRRESEYLIAGVDPGITTGVAAITLDGRLKLLCSGKELGRGQAIRLLSEVGTPIIVATDATPPPTYVKKLASALNAQLVTPPRPLTIEEKRLLVGNFSDLAGSPLKVKDTHQRDALTAALHAYSRIRPKFEEAREKVMRLGLEIPLDEVRALIAKGVGVWEAIRRVSRAYLAAPQRPAPPTKAEGAVTVPETALERVFELQRRVRELEREREELLEKVRELEEQLQRILSAQSYEIRRDREVEALRIRLESIVRDTALLREEVEGLKREKEALEGALAKAATGAAAPAPRLRGLGSALETLQRCETVVLSSLQPLDVRRLQELASKLRAKAIICESNYSEEVAVTLACHGVALLRLEEVEPLALLGEVYVIDRVKLEEAVRKRLSELENRSLKVVKDSFKRTVEGYRMERAHTATCEPRARDEEAAG